MAKNHALAREPVEMRRLAEIRPRKTRLLPAEVIGEDEDDVRRRRGGVGMSAEERNKRKEGEAAFHGFFLFLAASGNSADSTRACNISFSNRAAIPGCCAATLRVSPMSVARS